MKTKWFSASVQKNYKQLREKLVSHQFDENIGWGFQIMKFSPERLQVRYSERVPVNEIIIDPYGEKNIVEYNKYINFNFWLIPDVSGCHTLIIESPPRSIKYFIENFVKCINGSFYVSNKDIKIEKFVEYFKEHFKEVSFKKAKLKGLTFSKYTFGNLEVESSRDALFDIDNYFPNALYKLDKSKVFVVINEFSYCIEVTSSGTIVFDEDIFEDVIKAVSKL